MNTLIALSLLLTQAQPAPADSAARAIAPYLDELTVAVARIDLAKADVDSVVALLKRAGIDERLAPIDAATMKQAAADLREAGAREVFIVYSLADLLEGPFILVFMQDGGFPDAVSKTLARLRLRTCGEWGTIAKFYGGQAVALGTTRTIERLRKLQPTPRPELAKAFAAAGDAMLQIALMPTTDSTRILEELQPTLPNSFGGVSISVLTRGCLWIGIGVDVKPSAKVSVVVQSESPRYAEDLHRLVSAGLALAGLSSDVRRVLGDFATLHPLLVPKVSGDTLRLTLDSENQGVEKVLAALLPASRAALDRRRSGENLTQLLIALHKHHDARGAFPLEAVHSKDGKPLLSWRVRLLPYLDQQKLYDEFRLDEPWDSAHNKALAARIPAVFRSPILRKYEAGMTTYLAPRGAATMWPGGKELRFKDVSDGTSNTIFLVEAAEGQAVPWTKPDDWNFNPDDPRKGLTGAHPHGILAGFADGSIHFLLDTLDTKTLRTLFTRGSDDWGNWR